MSKALSLNPAISSSHQKVVVIDLSSVTTTKDNLRLCNIPTKIKARIGFSGENSPRFTFEIQVPSLAPYYMDKDALKIAIRAFMTNLFRVIFFDYLLIKTRLTSVLILEPIFWDKIWRDTAYSCLLFDYQVVSVSLQPALMLASLASGCRSGVLVNLGDDECEVLCFSDLRPLIQTYQYTKVGCRDVVRCIQEFEGISNRISNEELDDLRDRVVRGESISLEHLSTETSQHIAKYKAHINSLLLGLDTESLGVSHVILESLRSCNLDIRVLATKNIIFTGDGAGFMNIVNAITSSVSSIASDELNHSGYLALRPLLLNLRPFRSPFPAGDLSWIGGSVFASIKTNKIKFISLETATKSYHESSQVATEESSESLESTRDRRFQLDTIAAPDWLSLHNKDWTFFGPVTS